MSSKQQRKKYIKIYLAMNFIFFSLGLNDGRSLSLFGKVAINKLCYLEIHLWLTLATDPTTLKFLFTTFMNHQFVCKSQPVNNVYTKFTIFNTELHSKFDMPPDRWLNIYSATFCRKNTLATFYVFRSCTNFKKLQDPILCGTRSSPTSQVPTPAKLT
jgi:hypothetical protein